MSHNLFINILGWVGSSAILIAYALVSLNKIKPDSFIYQFLNIFGSGLLLVNTFYFGSFPASFLNFTWMCIGIFALISLGIKRNKKRSGKPVK